MLYDAVYNLLSTHAGTTALIGTRVYPDVAPENVSFPHVVFVQTADAPQDHFGGSSSVVEGAFSVECWAADRKQARDLETQTRLALNNKSGSYGGTTVKAFQKLDATDRVEPPREGQDRGSFVTDANYKAFYVQALA